MIPRTYPSSVNASTGKTQMVVYFLSSITGLQRWVDYIPVQWGTASTPRENSTDTGGYLSVDSLSSTTGKQAWVDYIPVYLDSAATGAWMVDSVGFLSIGLSGVGGMPIGLFAAGEQGGWWDPSDFNSYMTTGPELAYAGYATPVTYDNTTTVISSTAFSTTAGTNSTRANLNLTTEIGKTYVVWATQTTAPSSGSVLLYVRDLFNGQGNVITQLSSAYVTGVPAQLVFTATSTTTSLLWNSSVISVNYAFGSISVKQLPSISAATMYQDSAGTTPVTAVGQPVGLMLDKRLGAVRGAEMSIPAQWGVTPTGITKDSAAATVSFDGSQATFAALTLGSAGSVVGGWYEAVFTVSGYVQGGVQVRTGGANRIVNANGVHRWVFQAIDANGPIVQEHGSNPSRFIGTVSAISVKPLPGNHRTQSTAASRPTLSGRHNLLTATEDITSGAWTKEANGTAILPVVTKDYGAIAAPDGTFTAQRIQLDKGAGATSADRAEVYQGLAPAVNNTRRVWARTVSGSATVAVMATAAGAVRTLTTAWEECVVPGLTSERPRIMLRGDIGTSNTADILIWHPDLRPDADAALAIPAYQRVNSATDYDTAGFPLYLSYDGVDDWMQTASVDFSATDKMTVIAGVHKASDAAFAMFAELTANAGTTDGGFAIQAPNAAANYFGFLVRGTVAANNRTTSNAAYAAPLSSVLSCGFNNAAVLSTDQVTPRINGSIPAPMGAGTATTAGNFANAVLYFGRRGGTSNPFNGREYGTIIRGAATDASSLAATERYMASKTGITW